MNTGDKLPRKESEIQQEDRRSTVITLIPCSLTDMTFRVGLDYYSHWCSFFFFLYNGRACCAGIAIAEDAAGHILSRFQKWQRCHRFKQKQNPCYWTLHGNSVLRSRADCWRITEAINDVFDPPREIVPILADIRRLMPTFENVKFECWQGSWFSFCRLAGAAPVNNCNASDPIYCTPSSTPLIHNLICLSKKKRKKNDPCSRNCWYVPLCPECLPWTANPPWSIPPFWTIWVILGSGDSMGRRAERKNERSSTSFMEPPRIKERTIKSKWRLTNCLSTRNTTLLQLEPSPICRHTLAVAQLLPSSSDTGSEVMKWPRFPSFSWSKGHPTQNRFLFHLHDGLSIIRIKEIIEIC